MRKAAEASVCTVNLKLTAPSISHPQSHFRSEEGGVPLGWS